MIANGAVIFFKDKNLIGQYSMIHARSGQFVDGLKDLKTEVLVFLRDFYFTAKLSSFTVTVIFPPRFTVPSIIISESISSMSL